MTPEDVPTEFLALYGRNYEGATMPAAKRAALAAVLTEHEKQVRAKVEQEILADVAALFAARVGADLWEAAFHSAKVARGEDQ